MDNDKNRIWIKGYLEAIQDGGNVTKNHIEHLISNVKEMINAENESEEEKVDSNKNEYNEIGDDLPF